MTTFTLAGGCFWCLDAVFRQIQGVTESLCGYAGGDAPTASYYLVAEGKTGHAESVQITFDENVLAVEALLDIFFTLHDPTTKDRQGADVGPQYRSAMFYETDEQKRAFKAACTRAEKVWGKPTVTEIKPLELFYRAEPEHQNYFAQNPQNGYCSIVIEPKIVKVRNKFKQYFKEEA